MGCWNGTCGISQLPITNNEEIYVIPLLEKKGFNMCYTSALFKPSLIGFEAKYDGYGSGEQCHGLFLDRVIQTCRENLVEKDIGENEYHDIAVKRDEFGTDKFFEAVHEGRLEIKNYGRKDTKIHFSVIRKDVVDRLWTDWQFDVYVGKGNGSDPDDHYERNVTYAKYASQVPDMVQKMHEFFYGLNKSMTRTGDPVRDKIDKLSLRMFYRFSVPGVDDSFGRKFDRALENYNYAWQFSPKEEILDLIEAGELEKATEMLQEILRYVMIESFMGSTRRIWLPSTHQGSQSQDYDEYKLLGNIINDIIDDKVKEYDQ